MELHNLIEKISRSAISYPNSTFSDKTKVYTCVNPYSYHLVRKNIELYNNIDGIFVDGFLMCLAIRIFWRKKIPRLSFDMTGIAKHLFERINSTDESIYFIGSRSKEVEKSVTNILNQFPDIKIAGYRDGYFNGEHDRDNTINEIISINPNFVIVVMGSPLQEQFILDLKNRGYKGIAFTCGGFLHQTIESINYYPTWVNKYNLRAFYRLYKEKGLFGRMYNVLLEFPILFIKDSILSKLGK